MNDNEYITRGELMEVIKSLVGCDIGNNIEDETDTNDKKVSIFTNVIRFSYKAPGKSKSQEICVISRAPDSKEETMRIVRDFLETYRAYLVDAFDKAVKDGKIKYKSNIQQKPLLSEISKGNTKEHMVILNSNFKLVNINNDLTMLPKFIRTFCDECQPDVPMDFDNICRSKKYK